jgi:hypothetical protein
LLKESSSRKNLITTKESIDDRSKSDAFTKVFAIVQSSWLVIQSIARVSAGLPITELELATMAYVLCALVMYIFWWHKPFGVEHVTVISEVTRENLRFGSKWQRKPDMNFKRVVELFFGMVEGIEIQAVIFYGIATAFSATHLAAWNWEFPSPDVRILWRSFGLVATAAGPSTILCLFLIFAIEDCSGHLGDWGVNAAVVTLLISVIVYSISRLGLIVLIIYSFKSMPAGVYETVDWTNYFPFFS